MGIGDAFSNMSWKQFVNPLQNVDEGGFHGSNFTNTDAIGNGFESAFGLGKYDPKTQDLQALRNQIAMGNAQGAASGKFADQLQGNYGADVNHLNNTYGQIGDSMNYLKGIGQGQNSVSAEQLRQSLGQNLAAQQSMAAGASPQNSAMAARTAARNQASLGSGLAGQQALAGMQERNNAWSQYGQLGSALGQLQLGARGQDLSGANNARGNAINAYGQGSAAYGTALQNPQKGADIGGFAPGLLAMAASDKRLKTDIEDGDESAKKTLEGLKSYAFRYKDEKYGKGKQSGVMAQDMKKAGLGHAVVDTPDGLMVHGAKAATSALGLVAALGRRVSKLEGSGK